MSQPTRLKVGVDRARCQGHARCNALAPELFELDDLGNAREIGDGKPGPTTNRLIDAFREATRTDGPEV